MCANKTGCIVLLLSVGALGSAADEPAFPFFFFFLLPPSRKPHLNAGGLAVCCAPGKLFAYR